MGNSFNKAIFNENVQVGILGWARGAKKNKKGTVVDGNNKSENSEAILLQNVVVHDSAIGRGGNEISEV